MRQHPLDLMPASIRARSQAGMRVSRFAAMSGVLLIITIVVATHSRLGLTASEEQVTYAKAEAEAVFAVDAKAAELRNALNEALAAIAQYEKVAFPLPVSAVMATVINALPESVTLDQFDLDAGTRVVARTSRAKGGDGKVEAAQRTLRCEISGFAATDDHIAQLVNRLEATQPFRQVNLDFSRTKIVNDHDAREFRLSFRIDLGVAYEVTYDEDGPEAFHALAEEVADAQ